MAHSTSLTKCMSLSGRLVSDSYIRPIRCSGSVADGLGTISRLQSGKSPRPRSRVLVPLADHAQKRGVIRIIGSYLNLLRSNVAVDEPGADLFHARPWTTSASDRIAFSGSGAFFHCSRRMTWNTAGVISRGNLTSSRIKIAHAPESG